MMETARLMLAAAVVASASAAQPNLFFVMVDDWGHYDVGFRGNGNIKTPVIDKMVAEEALLLNRHYTFKYCSPTRRSFLSGRFPTHQGQDNGPQVTVDLRVKTIADKLASAGYECHQAGKWHAGHATVFQAPTGRGFKTSLGYFNGACDHYTQQDSEDGCGEVTDLWDSDRPAHGMNGTYGDYLYTGRAVSVIESHDVTTPLFFYLALQCAHDPMEVPAQYKAIYSHLPHDMQVEYGFSSVIDEAIGNVTAALKSKGMWENTVLVVSSDNGGPAFSDQAAASNYPLRGGKYTLWEGGLRVTAFVSGGLLPAGMRGTNTSAPIHICDWYSTFSKMAGVDPTDDHDGVPSIDSIDQTGVIFGQTTTPARDELFPASGILISGRWKLSTTGMGTDKWSGPMYPSVPAESPKMPFRGCSTKSPCLWDIVSDPDERAECSSDNTALVTKLVARLSTLMQGVFSSPEANVTRDAICAMTVTNGNFLTPSDWTPPSV